MKVLVLNPGATSTKISIFEEENEVFKTNLVHHAADLAPYAHVIDQGPFRKQLILETVEKAGYQMTDFDAVCGRGGRTRPLPMCWILPMGSTPPIWGFSWPGSWETWLGFPPSLWTRFVWMR